MPTDGRRVGSLIHRIREWFIANPGEYLSYSDAAVKFGITEIQVQQAMSKLRAEGVCETAHVCWTTPGYRP